MPGRVAQQLSSFSRRNIPGLRTVLPVRACILYSSARGWDNGHPSLHVDCHLLIMRARAPVPPMTSFGWRRLSIIGQTEPCKRYHSPTSPRTLWSAALCLYAVRLYTQREARRIIVTVGVIISIIFYFAHHKFITTKPNAISEQEQDVQNSLSSYSCRTESLKQIRWLA